MDVIGLYFHRYAHKSGMSVLTRPGDGLSASRTRCDVRGVEGPRVGRRAGAEGEEEARNQRHFASDTIMLTLCRELYSCDGTAGVLVAGGGAEKNRVVTEKA